MTSARRVEAIVVCVGLTACLAGIAGLTGLAGRLTDDQNPRRGGASARQASDPTQSAGNTNQATSSVPKVDEGAVRMAAAQALLSTRAAAVKARSKSAWMATVDLPRSAFGERQAVAFDNLITLPLGEFSYDAVRLAPALAPARVRQVGPKAWVAAASGTYSLAGFDLAPRPFEATYTLVRRSGGWRIADDTDGATPLQLWDLRGLKVMRGKSAIVIGNAPAARMRAYREIADPAVRRVSGVWGTDWNSHVVILTPSTDEEFASLLLRRADKGLDQVAAVAQGVVDPGQRAQGDRIVINPMTFTALQPDGRRMVVTHELTHIAARSSTTRAVPMWLSEGMADYVGFSGLGLPRERTAIELLALVRAGKVPRVLPKEAAFDPSRTKIALSYSESLLAVSHLVDLYGQDRVVAFYRAIAGGLTVDRAVQLDPDAVAAKAFPLSFGVTEAQFVDGWKRSMRTLARTQG